MAKLKLTYHKARRCWRKKRKVNGKDRIWYLGDSNVNKTDTAAYAKALAEWEKIEAELEGHAERQRLDRIRDEHAEVLDVVEWVRAEPGNREMRMAAEIAVASHGVADHPDFALPGDGNNPSTIAHHVEQFLATFSTKVKLDNRSLARRYAIQAHLYRWRDWTPTGESQATGQRPISSISAAMLAGFYDHLAGQVADKAMSAYTGRDSLMAVKQFIRWAWERELCSLPRNIDSRNMTLQVPAATVKVYSPDELRRLIDAASDRTRALMAIALNIGGTQKDLADLAPGEVDLKAGTIVRKRSKTKKHENVPEVKYTLWSSTIDALKQYGSTSGERVLLTTSGEPLLRVWTKDGGKQGKVDTVRLGFVRLIKKVNNQKDADGKTLPKIDGSFKRLRATAANMLEQNPTYKSVRPLYLAHAPSGVGERHYVRGDEKLLAEGLKWLGQELGLDK